MKKLRIIAMLMILCMALSGLTMVATAEEQVVSGAWNDTVNWSLDKATGTMTFSGTGNIIYDSDGSYAPYVDDIKIAVVPASIKELDDLFNYRIFESIERILVDDAHPAYTDIDGVVYNKNVTCLENLPVAYPGECVIPEGVITMNDMAFDYCLEVTSLTIPSTMKDIFYEYMTMPNLEKITVAEGNPTYYSDSRGVMYDKRIQSVARVPDQYTGEFVIPQTIRLLQPAYAIRGCHKLTGIIAHAGVTDLDNWGDWAFYYCDNLAGIWVDKDNPKFCSDKQGVLYTKDMKKLLRMPSGLKCSSYQVPEGVTHIEECAFDTCRNLKSITLPDSLTRIGGYAFYKCTGLTELTIPANVSAYGEYAFDGCKNLKSVSFLGDPVWKQYYNVGERVFGGAKLTCYYPANSEAWADGPGRDNGTITWVADPCLPAHTETLDSGKAPTCTESGLTDGKHCAVCGKVLLEQSSITATGHQYGKWTEIQAPTAEQTGLAERTCVFCGHKEQKRLEKLEPEDPQPTDSVPTLPDVTEPETMDPVPTEPDVTEPIVTEPDVTEPIVTEPESTNLAETMPTESVQTPDSDDGDAVVVVVVAVVVVSLGGGAAAVFIMIKKFWV